MSVGPAFDPVYVARLASMLHRHLPEPFRLRCLTDRPDALPEGVEAVDASGWELESWFNKLRLFDSEVTGPEPFLYLDLSLVMKGNLGPLLEFARGAERPLVAVRDWHYASLNSSVMWITPGPVTQAVWDDYAAGVRYETRLKTDQDHLNAAIGDRVAFFPEGMVASYKALRKLNHRSPAEARRRLEEATILKFHGEPKPHQLLHRRTALWMALRDARRHPRHLVPNWRFLEAEVRRWWG